MWDILNIPAFLPRRCSEMAELSKEGFNVGD
jgi:hypothetical protein